MTDRGVCLTCKTLGCSFLCMVKQRDAAASAVADLRSQRNAARYDASLLAEMVHLLYGPPTGLYLNQDMKSLVERHYKPGVIEPSGDTVPHPYRMTPELAENLTRLVGLVETNNDLTGLAMDIADELRRQQG